MKHNLSILLLFFILGLLSCSDDDDDSLMENIEDNTTQPIPNLDFRQEMRDFVIGLSSYSKNINSDFIVIPQNGIELISNNGEADGPLNMSYLNAIDAHGQEDLFYGYNNDNEETPVPESDYIIEFLNESQKLNKTILVTDYCSSPNKMDVSYNRNREHGFISFAADQRELDNIPTYPNQIQNENSININDISSASNFLYLINPGRFNSKSEFINKVTSTNYDLLIMDLFFDGDELFTESEIESLKKKANGGTRLVVAYMSIGEAEDYRFYWEPQWDANKPEWIEKENANWPGNFKVRYWEQEWQNIIYGNSNSYLGKILESNFDGVYLDIISAYEYFEG